MQRRLNDRALRLQPNARAICRTFIGGGEGGDIGGGVGVFGGGGGGGDSDGRSGGGCDGSGGGGDDGNDRASVGAGPDCPVSSGGKLPSG